ncbi:MAG: zinc-ribbon domain containing protein [Dehalococcoidia bacterium]
MPYTDKTLTCADCGAGFTFSAEDQEYHASRGFQNEPRRCPSCRQQRRAEKGEGGGGGGGGYRQLFAVVCGDCGRDTEVPFEPRGDRPVYCRSCFAKHAPARSSY